MFCDASQVHRNRDAWESFRGVIFNSTGVREQRDNSIQMRSLSGKGFSRDLVAGIFVGRSSTYAALQVALWLDYDRIYLFGVDMCGITVKGKLRLHYYGINPDVQAADRIKRFDAEAVHYEHAAGSLSPELRNRYFFCSDLLRYPFADKFRRLSQSDAIDHLLEYAALHRLDAG
jgi:hypothetical protein